jgi:diaminohydroxyphosphoribosylaminopyrimidine deaminase/5-amino-6-(5-phosphoribosylamino)uracil reductase
VILDSHLRIPLTAKLLHQPDPEKSVVITSDRSSRPKTQAIELLGARVWRVKLRHERISWRAILRKLADEDVLSVMIESGAATAAWALQQGAVDKILFFYAPKILGGDGRVMIDNLGIKRVKQSIGLQKMRVQKSGPDILVSAYLGKG